MTGRASFLVLLAAAACGSPGRPAEFAVAPDVGPTLEAAVLRPSGLGGIEFWVSRPSYVAMFWIRPGRSIDLLYPWIGGRGAGVVSAGTHLGVISSSTVHWASVGDGSRKREPSYIYLIASDLPLRMRGVSSYSFALRSRLAAAYYGTIFQSGQALESEILEPGLQDHQWTSAFYVVFPEPQAPAWRFNRVVRCPDGSLRVEDLNAVTSPCPPSAGGRDSVRTDSTRMRPPADSLRYRRPEKPGRTADPTDWRSYDRRSAKVASALLDREVKSGARDRRPLGEPNQPLSLNDVRDLFRRERQGGGGVVRPGYRPDPDRGVVRNGGGGGGGGANGTGSNSSGGSAAGGPSSGRAVFDGVKAEKAERGNGPP